MPLILLKTPPGVYAIGNAGNYAFDHQCVVPGNHDYRKKSGSVATTWIELRS